MDIMEKLICHNVWLEYYEYKLAQGNLVKKEQEDLYKFVADREYMPVAQKCIEGGQLSLPRKTFVNKSKVGRKRAVYSYSREENYILKLITYLLHKYDYAFSPNLYSFRSNSGVKTAVDYVLRMKDISSKYVYKLDISNYFNSVNVDIILPMLKKVLTEDERLYSFISEMLINPYVIYEGETIKDQKGIMAGVPISTFLANLYLKDLDYYFCKKRIPYMRYSDDVIVFADSEEELSVYVAVIKEHLEKKRLTLNPEKEKFVKPCEKWEFLGFSYENGTFDISDMAFAKLKAKMRRKTRSLERWARKKQVSGDRAARAFIRVFNKKLYSLTEDDDFNWTRWYFPIINTHKTLKLIDSYMIDCIRYLSQGTRTKSRYNLRYETIKEFGFVSLVNEYYKFKNNKDSIV